MASDRLDLLLSVIPRYTEIWDPPAGVACISAAAKQAGFRSKVVDFNLTFTKFMREQDLRIYREIDLWMAERPLPNLNLRRETEWITDLSVEAREACEFILNRWIETVVEHDPIWMGVSVFTDNSRRMAKIFLRRLKQRLPEIKLIAGGAGTSPFDEELRALVDYYVEGEGEEAIVQILNGDGANASGTNGNPVRQIKDLNDLPWPDYSDLDLSKYDSRGKSIRITGSRGCTRRCNFCNVYLMWPKFTYRSGESLVNEMFHQHETLSTHPTLFTFSDSLINGNIACLRELCRGLIARQADFRFVGQFIAVGERSMMPEDFALLREAGCATVYLGIESGSESVRKKMNKLFSNSDLYYCVEQLAKNGIEMIWLMIVGFPEETEEDFEETCELIRKFAHLNRDKYKIQVSMHEFVPFTEVDWTRKNLPHLDLTDFAHWKYAGNPRLDRKERMRRMLKLERLVSEKGYKNHYLTMEKYSDFSIESFVKEAVDADV